MAGRWPLLGLLLLALAGCTAGGLPAALLPPEQTHLDVREPEQIPSALIPPMPPPATVSEPNPPGETKELSLDEAIHIALANARVVRVLPAGPSNTNALGAPLSLNYETPLSRFPPGVFPLNPQDQSALTLAYTQPLLKGAGLRANLAPIVIARLDTERSFFQLKDALQEL